MDKFIDAPQLLSGEQNLVYYDLYQKYLKLYEGTLMDYIESMDVSINEFYRELAAVKDDKEIKDKKMLHFVNYLVASTDYESFYKVMGRAAKRGRKVEERADAKSPGGGGQDVSSKMFDEGAGADSKNEGKSDDYGRRNDSKADSK